VDRGESPELALPTASIAKEKFPFVMLSGLKSRASLEVFPDQLGAAEPHLY
jgi:hypothetical protein